MTSSLHKQRRSRACVSGTKRPKGWTPERRLRQAALIRRWRPWRHSTGPRTESGKAVCGANPTRHGNRSHATILELQRVRFALRLAAYTSRACARSSASAIVRRWPWPI